MATVNDPFGDAARADIVDNARGSADADTMTVDRDLNRIFAATVRRPPPPLSKKKQLEVKKEFRGTPQRGHGLTVVMALAVAVGLFGLCVWTLMDKVQDVSSGEPAGSAAPIAAVAYNKSSPPSALSASAATAGSSAQSVVATKSSTLPPVVENPPVMVAPPAPPPPIYAKAPVTVAPPPVAAPLARIAVLPAPIRAPMLAKVAAPPAAPVRIAAPLPKPSPQLAYNKVSPNKVSPPRPTSGSGAPTADAMMRALAAQPLRSTTTAEHGQQSSTDTGAPTATTDARACDSATSCGSYGLVQAADTRLSRAFAAAAEAGVPQQLLGDVKGRWTGLRSDTSRRPSELLADYGSLTKSLWKARDVAVGGQRATGDHSLSDQAHPVSSQ